MDDGPTSQHVHFHVMRDLRTEAAVIDAPGELVVSETVEEAEKEVICES